MRPSQIHLLSLVLIIFAAVSPASLRAETAPELCPGTFQSEDFVRESNLICMQDLPSRRSNCMRDAEAQFYRCHLKGNFRRISNRVQTKLIVLSLFKSFISPQGERYNVASRNQ